MLTVAVLCRKTLSPSFPVFQLTTISAAWLQADHNHRMAVIDSLGISVHVQVNGAAAVEYADPDPSPDAEYPDTPVVSKYIESKDDIEYAVACMTLPPHDWLSTHKDYLLSFQVCADGKHRSAKIYKPYDHDTRYTLIVDGVKVRPRGASHETLSKFKFDAVKIGKCFGPSSSTEWLRFADLSV